MAEWAGVSVGGVDKCTKRVLVAVLALHDQEIHPPTEEEKELSKRYVEERTCPEWRGGCLTTDGTHFPLCYRPGLFGENWFDKDGNYSSNAQVRFSLISSAL